MHSSPRDNYLVTEVMTATPQKLQLMLIEAAIRAVQQARHQWQQRQDDQACESLIHAQHIVGEMMASLNREANPELVGRVAAVYLFVFRSLMEANYQHDEKKLDDAMRILAMERETWQQVCAELGSTKAAAKHLQGNTQHPSAPSTSTPAVSPTTPPGTAIDLPQADPAASDVSPGLSLEA